MANPNPNEPNFPYSGGTDNPGDDTSKAGGPSNVASVETSLPSVSAAWTNGHVPSQSLAASVERHPPLPVGIAQGGAPKYTVDTGGAAFKSLLGAASGRAGRPARVLVLVRIRCRSRS